MGNGESYSLTDERSCEIERAREGFEREVSSQLVGGIRAH